MRDEVALLTAIWNAAGSNRNRISGCPNFLHRYSDVYFCVYFSLPSWQYFKECPCGLLKLKAFFFFTTILTDIWLRFCVYFLFVSSPDSHGFPCRCSSLLALFVFFTILTEVSRFLCIFSLVLWLKILTVFVVAYDSRTILTEFILFFLTFPFCAFLR